MSFPKYEKYKDSGVEWLGEVPTHWEILNGRRVFRNRSEIALREDIQLAASQKYGIIPQSLMIELNNSKVMLALKGTESFRHVEKNDFVISLRSFEGGIEYSNYAGCVSPAYTVLALIKDNDPNFYRYSLKSKGFIAALQSTTDSLRDGKSITYQQFCDIPLVIPTKTEQQVIALFLDRETAKIDELVAEQQRLIELLKEKRQAVISHAVTRGLNPNIKLKPSGIEWLGDVPEHWGVKPLKSVVFMRSGEQITANDIDVEGLYPVFGGNGLRGFTTKFTHDGYFPLIGRQGALCGNINYGNGQFWASEHAVVVTPVLKCSIFWLGETLRTMNLGQYSVTAAQPGLSVEAIGNLRIPFPDFKEQQVIADFLTTQTAKFDTLTAEAQRAIDLLQERRAALISAAVTGKIDVRQLNKN